MPEVGVLIGNLGRSFEGKRKGKGNGKGKGKQRENKAKKAKTKQKTGKRKNIALCPSHWWSVERGIHTIAARHHSAQQFKLPQLHTHQRGICPR